MWLSSSSSSSSSIFPDSSRKWTVACRVSGQWPVLCVFCAKETKKRDKRDCILFLTYRLCTVYRYYISNVEKNNANYLYMSHCFIIPNCYYYYLIVVTSPQSPIGFPFPVSPVVTVAGGVAGLAFGGASDLSNASSWVKFGSHGSPLVAMYIIYWLSNDM